MRRRSWIACSATTTRRSSRSACLPTIPRASRWFEPERVLDAGDRVVVLVRVVAEGGVSGIPTERETAHVWTARHGRLSSIQIYRDRAEALEAAGLEG